MTENEKKNISKHILPTASNLLGLCFVILTFIKLSRLSNETIIDDYIGGLIILFLISGVLSYISMRTKIKSDFYEKLADMIFLIGLCLLTLISLVIVFEVI